MMAAIEDALCMTQPFTSFMEITFDYRALAKHMLDGVGRRGYVLREAVD